MTAWRRHVQKIHGEIIIVLLLIFPGVKTQTEKNNTLMESEKREGLQGDPPPPPLLTQTKLIPASKTSRQQDGREREGDKKNTNCKRKTEEKQGMTGRSEDGHLPIHIHQKAGWGRQGWMYGSPAGRRWSGAGWPVSFSTLSLAGHTQPKTQTCINTLASLCENTHGYNDSLAP